MIKIRLLKKKNDGKVCEILSFDELHNYKLKKDKEFETEILKEANDWVERSILKIKKKIESKSLYKYNYIDLSFDKSYCGGNKEYFIAEVEKIKAILTQKGYKFENLLVDPNTLIWYIRIYI